MRDIIGRRRPRERTLPYFGCAVGGLAATVILVRLAAGAGLLEGTPLDGIDYLPPWWLAGIVLPIVLSCLALRSRRTAYAVATLFVVLVGCDEDWHWHRPSAIGLEAPSFSVLAYNVRYYQWGRRAVVRAVKSLDPDVVLLSENRVDAAGLVLLRDAFAPYQFVSGRPGETAIASRLPILDAQEIELPTRAPTLHRGNRLDEQLAHPHRSFMHARLDFHGTAVNVIAVRLIAGQAASDALADEIEWGRYLLAAQREEGRCLREYVSHLEGPIVFGGDLNAPPTARLIRELDHVASDAYLANHWFGLPTFPAKTPTFRLDYLFSMNGAVATSAARPRLDLSDHYPILARFSLTSS